MQPISIRLRGFKGFRAGLGLDEVFIDFTKLPKGLIAIVGKNGMGKTSLLDNLHPFRIMPYKLRESKEWTPGGFSFYDQCFGRNAMKEYIFLIDGKSYKSVILIDAERRKQEAYLYRMDEDGTWMNYSDAVKDGKTGAYDQAVEELVGSPSLFFSSAFRSQDARKLSSYPRSEILSIVCELLNIERIKAQGEKANKTVLALENLADDLERQKLPMIVLLGTVEDLESKRNAAILNIDQREDSLNSLKTELSAVQEKIHHLELANAAQSVTRQRVAEMKQRHASLLSDIKELEEKLNTSVVDFQSESDRISSAIKLFETEQKRDMDALAVEENKEKTEANTELNNIGTRRKTAEALLDRTDEINQATARDAELEQLITDNRIGLNSLNTTHAILNANIAECLSKLSGIARSIEQNNSELVRESTALAAEERREIATADSELAGILTKKKSVEAVLARADEVGKAVLRESELNVHLSASQLRLEELRTDYNSLLVKAAESTSIANELRSCQARLQDLRNQAGGLKGLDCHENGTNQVNKTCKLLATAVAAEKQIPDVVQEINLLLAKQFEMVANQQQLEKIKQDETILADQVAKFEADLVNIRKITLLIHEVNNASTRITELNEQEAAVKDRLSQRKADIAAKLQNLSSRSQDRQKELSAEKEVVSKKNSEADKEMAQVNCDLVSTSEQLSGFEAELVEVRKVAQLVFELDNAASRIGELDTLAASVRIRVDQRVKDIASKRDNLAKRLQNRQSELVSQRENIESRWTTAKPQMEHKLATLKKDASLLVEEIRQLEATLDGGVDGEILVLERVIAIQMDEIATSENSLKGLHAEMGAIQVQLIELDKKQQELGRLDIEIAKIREEMINWKLLAKACSNDGIIALELDDAGPAIASVTNELLHACYGPRFSVRLETQTTKADGGLKEVFDITVFDAERDEEKSIRDMSGGEVTYIEDAITRAFCLYNLHRSDRKYDTLFADEKDGALDADRKHEFMAIKRQALSIGTHDREIFITQTPELYEQADARIELVTGSINMVYV